MLRVTVLGGKAAGRRIDVRFGAAARGGEFLSVAATAARRAPPPLRIAHCVHLIHPHRPRVFVIVHIARPGVVEPVVARLVLVETALVHESRCATLLVPVD
jgi:hypothetical protein